MASQMEFEWDEAKREANLDKHGLDFLDARTICLTALGVVGEDEIIVAVVYTVRGETLRLISARRARRNERHLYQDRFKRGS